MTTLMKASNQWRSRPDDERYTNLFDMQAHFQHLRETSRAAVVPSRKVMFKPSEADEINGLLCFGPNGHEYEMTHWSLGQVSQLAQAPAGYIRTLPAALAADNLNYGLQVARDVEDVGVLLTRNGGAPVLRAATGPNYGRIWNVDLINALVARFGDGVTGSWKVPGEFGKDVEVTKQNTTLYASDRDMFVFLADEKNRIELPNRRNGEAGTMARGFFVWNSEVGAASLGFCTFLFDFVCCNRIVWGAEQVHEIRLRHTVSAPERWLDEVEPILVEYSNASAKPVLAAIEDARSKKIDNVEKFLANRFTKNLTQRIMQAHISDEGRPIETVWDAVTGITAAARTIKWQDERVSLEREAGKLMKVAA